MWAFPDFVAEEEFLLGVGAETVLQDLVIGFRGLVINAV
jgi:hypothetical protein